MHFRFTGTITTLSPVCVIQHTIEKNAKPGFVTTLNMSVGGGIHLGAIAGGTLRGKLRHGSSRLVMDAFAAAEGRPFESTIPTGEVVWLSLGGIGDSAAMSKTTDVVAAHRLKTTHPIFGLYGGVAPFLTEGSLKVGFAMADPLSGATQPDVQYYMRRDPLLADTGLAASMAKDDIDGYLSKMPEVSRRGKARARITKIDGELRRLERKSGPTVEAQRAALMAEKDNLSGVVKAVNDAGIQNSVAHPIAAVYALPAGLALSHNMICRNMPEEHIGLLLETLCSFEDECTIGGKTGIGYGAVRFEYDLAISDGRRRPWRSAGRLVVEDGHLEFDRDHPEVQPLLAAWAKLAADASRLPRSAQAFDVATRGGDEDAA